METGWLRLEKVVRGAETVSRILKGISGSIAALHPSLMTETKLKITSSNTKSSRNDAYIYT